MGAGVPVRATVAATVAMGAAATVTVDGSAVPVTCAPVVNYTPSVGDRLIVQTIDNVLEIIKFSSIAIQPQASYTGTIGSGTFTLGQTPLPVTLSVGGSVSAQSLANYQPTTGDSVIVIPINNGSGWGISAVTSAAIPVNSRKASITGGPYNIGDNPSIQIANGGPSTTATGLALYQPTNGDTVWVVPAPNGNPQPWEINELISVTVPTHARTGTVATSATTPGNPVSVNLDNGGGTITATGQSGYQQTAGDRVEVNFTNGAWAVIQIITAALPVGRLATVQSGAWSTGGPFNVALAAGGAVVAVNGTAEYLPSAGDQVVVTQSESGYPWNVVSIVSRSYWSLVTTPGGGNRIEVSAVPGGSDTISMYNGGSLVGQISGNNFGGGVVGTMLVWGNPNNGTGVNGSYVEVLSNKTVQITGYDSGNNFGQIVCGPSGITLNTSGSGVSTNANFSTTGGSNITASGQFTGTQIQYSGTIPAASSSTACYFASNGVIVKLTSSQRYKEDIQPLEYTVEQILALEPKRYVRTGEDGTEIGVIAEEAHELGLTDLVNYEEIDGLGVVPDGFDYTHLSVAQQVVLRHQAHQIASLQDLVQALVRRVEVLEGRSF
ncbi:MAG: tail fiber domain-containing protein [Bacillota bacterium]